MMPVRPYRAVICAVFIGVVSVCLLCACSKQASIPPAPDAAAPPVTAPAAAPAKGASAKKSSAKVAPVVPPAPKPATEAEMVAAKSAGEELKTEEPEENPYSETVTLKVSVTPPVKAQVTWGAKTVAKLAPGGMEAEIVRPRGSGPVDLEIKAEGYLPYHTRLYTDRNEKVGVRLYRAEEAPGLFGYKRSASASEKKK
jgi:hypothetical protein